MKKRKILLISHDFTLDGATCSLLSTAKVLAKNSNISVWSLRNGLMYEIFKKELNIEPLIVDIDDRQFIKKEIQKYDFIYINTIVTYKIANICEEIGIPYMWVIREATNIPELCKLFNINPNELSSIIKKCKKSTYTISEYAKGYIDKTYNINVSIIKNFTEDNFQKEHKFNNKNIVFTIMGCHEARKQSVK